MPVDMPLVIVGDAPYATEYKEQLRAAADDQVIFTGFQFGEAYQEFQSNCYLYIQATEVGGTHPALIESMSYGNCVVVNGTPENLEVIAGAGESFEKNNFDQLADILGRLVTSPDLVQKYGRIAESRVMERYSWESVVSSYEGLLESLVR
jgi:glycosyltransferase involved in cell wall biosynthesis